MRSLRTFDLEPSIKLLGFKDRSELVFEDNVRHSLFIYPDEDTYAGSRRTFTALLSSMVKKGKFGLVRALTRRNASPSFCALLPQEGGESEGWAEPSGFHLITLPFADDIRAAPIDEGFRGELLPSSKSLLALSSTRLTAGKELIDAAKSLISKLALRNGTYPPDSYPNPGEYSPALCQVPALRARRGKHWPSTMRSSRQLHSGRSSIRHRSRIPHCQRMTRSAGRRVR